MSYRRMWINGEAARSMPVQRLPTRDIGHTAAVRPEAKKGPAGRFHDGSRPKTKTTPQDEQPVEVLEEEVVETNLGRLDLLPARQERLEEVTAGLAATLHRTGRRRACLDPGRAAGGR